MSGTYPLAVLRMTFQQYQALFAISLQAACRAQNPPMPVPNLTSGSTIGPVGNGVSMIATQLQAQADASIDYARLDSIDNLGDLVVNPAIDSFVAPFMPLQPGTTSPRLGGTYATTSLTLGVASPSNTAFPVPLGAIYWNPVTGARYVVVKDTSQPAYSDAVGLLGGYLVPANPVGASTITVSVVCLDLGSVGNGPVNSITAPWSGPGNPAVPGITIISNAQQIANGYDGETNSALKARFKLQGGQPKYGVRSAILSAIAGVQTGLTYQYGDHINPDGSHHGAYFCVIVNNANSPTGPPQALKDAVALAVDARRAGGIEFDVFGPSRIPVVVTAAITLAAGAVHDDVFANLVAAVSSYVNGIGLDPNGGTTTCSWGTIVALLRAVPGVSAANNVLVNGAALDLVAPFASQFSSSTVAGSFVG